MSWYPKYTAGSSLNGLSVRFTDITGDYHVTNNPLGWGAPNPEEVSIFEALLTITKPTSTFEVGTEEVIVNLMDYGYPTVNKTFNIPASVLGYSSGLADGVYRFSLLIKGAVAIDAYVWHMFVKDGIMCCLDAKVLAAGKCKCKKLGEKELERLRLLEAIYAIEMAEVCQDIENGVEELQYASKICANENCKPCRGC